MNTIDSTETMKAIVLEGVGEISYKDIPKPDLEEGKALIRVSFCGICGSDIPRSFVKGTYSFPTVCGHEFAGVIEDIKDVHNSFNKGDRVAVFPLLWNDSEAPCETGNYAQSVNYDYLGSRSNGGFAEYVTVPVRNIIKIPDNVSLDEAAMTEPAAVALHAARRANIRLGDTISIFGLGPIGLMLAQWVRSMGASKVFLFDILEDKLQLARELGFTYVYNSMTSDPLESIYKETEDRGVHVSFEAAGVAPTFISALEVTRNSGKIIMLGNPSQDVTIPAPLISNLMRREVEILGTWNSKYSVYSDDDDWRSTLQAFSDGTLDLKKLITHRYPLKEGINALEMMRDNKESYCKVLIQP